MHRIILKYDHHYITGPLKGLTVQTRVNLTDMVHVRSFIQSLLSKRSSEGHIVSVINGDHYIPGNFEVEPYEIEFQTLAGCCTEFQVLIPFPTPYTLL